MFSPKVLVLDDDSDFLEGIKAILESANCRYIATSDSSTIQQKVRSFRPNLLLLDIYLNGQNGQEIAKVIKQTRDTTNLPIILISQSREIESISRQVNADGFLHKPFDGRQLIDTIFNFV